jgi:hypothetical protein
MVLLMFHYCMLYSFVNHMVLQAAFLYFRFVLHRTSRIYECLYTLGLCYIVLLGYIPPQHYV